jgi:ribosome-associated protein
MAEKGEREPLRVTRALRIPVDEIAVRYDTSGGPGGQHANRSQTRVELSFDAAASPSLDEDQRRRIVAELGPVVTAGAGDSRSQNRNRQLAFERLATKLADALHVDPPRRPTSPTRAASARRVDSKRRAGHQKQLRRPPSGED